MHLGVVVAQQVKKSFPQIMGEHFEIGQAPVKIPPNITVVVKNVVQIFVLALLEPRNAQRRTKCFINRAKKILILTIVVLPNVPIIFMELAHQGQEFATKMIGTVAGKATKTIVKIRPTAAEGIVRIIFMELARLAQSFTHSKLALKVMVTMNVMKKGVAGVQKSVQRKLMRPRELL